MSKTTTPTQYEKLLEMMATRKDIAQGFSKRPKEEAQAFWEDVANVINSLGPPSKNATAWRKVWIDWKCYVKRKLSANKKEMASTGGGRCNLQRISPIEEKVIELTGLETCTSGISGALDFGESAGHEYGAEGDPAMDISACSAHSNVAPSSSKGRKREKDSTPTLLQKQISAQKDFYENVKIHNGAMTNALGGMQTYLRRMNRSIEKLADNATLQLAEQKRHNAAKEDLLRKKIEIKMKMLQLEHPNYDFDWD